MSRAMKMLEMALEKPPILLAAISNVENGLDSPENLQGNNNFGEDQAGNPTLIDENTNINNIATTPFLGDINEINMEKGPSNEKLSAEEDVEKKDERSEPIRQIVTDVLENNNAAGFSDIDDPEYRPTDNEIEDAEKTAESETSARKRQKRNHVKEENWSRTKNQRKRELGETYDGKKLTNEKWNYKISKDQRQMKSRCACKISTKNQIAASKPTLKCFTLTEADRQSEFEKFWKRTWKEKQLFVQLNMKSSETARYRNRKAEEKSRRANSFTYFLRKGNEPIKVCKKMFLNTLSIGEWTARSWKLKENESAVAHETADEHISEELEPSDLPQENTSNKRKRKDPVRIASIKQFFESLPKMESHYCRSTSEKLYLEPIWRSKQELYELYCTDWCPSKNVDPFSIKYFDDCFNDMNLSLFQRKKDECDLCAGHKAGNISEDVFRLHQDKKVEARKEKEKDKASNVGKCFTMDLEAVLLCPKSNVSSMYYKTKLAVHNFTIYNLKSHDGFCFVWSEIEGAVGANEFSTILTYFIESLNVQEGDELIFYSDGCTGQNRNATLSSALLNIAVLHKIRIVQKYLERGHTQMECDTMHSAIEGQIRKKIINVPADYFEAIQKARKRPKPYQVKYLEHNFFRNFNSIQYVSSIRPGRKVGDPTVTDLRALMYNPDGTINFKLRHSDNWQLLPIRANKRISLGVHLQALPRLYEEKLKIKKEKFEHLQALKTTMPSDYHAFYDSLEYHQ